MTNRQIYPLALYLANDAREREIRAAEQSRRAAVQQPRQSVRQNIGRSIVRIGARLAGEPSLELARFR